MRVKGSTLPCGIVPDADSFIHTARGDELLANTGIHASDLTVMVAFGEIREGSRVLNIHKNETRWERIRNALWSGRCRRRTADRFADDR